MATLAEIKFDELLKIVKNLPEDKLSELKKEIDKDSKQGDHRDDFKTLLLNGPVFSNDQLDNIAKTRKALNKWRTK